MTAKFPSTTWSLQTPASSDVCPRQSLTGACESGLIENPFHCPSRIVPATCSEMLRSQCSACTAKTRPCVLATRTKPATRQHTDLHEGLPDVNNATLRQTFKLDNPETPGCNSPQGFCQPRTESSWYDQPGSKGASPQFNGVPCGFEGYQPPAYLPSDMKIFLERHAKYGEPWNTTGYHSGYNEVILSSSEWNTHLPHAVEAFFVLDENHADGDQTGRLGINVRQARKAFLAEYGLEPAAVPLLLMDPWNWDEPFIVLDES